jgi:D-alanyl-D-alanine carboxypeptidase
LDDRLGNRRWIVALLAGVILLAGTGVLVGRAVTERSSPATPGLQRILDGLVGGDSRIAPGAVAYLSGPHGTWIGTAGLADVSAGLPTTANARMRLESLSKLWVAVVVLQLVEEHKMRLSDTVAHWLPGLLPYGSRITVRELLNMTSGLIDTNDIQSDLAHFISEVKSPSLRAQLGLIAQHIEGDPSFEFSPLAWVRFAAALPLVNEPGTSFHYSSIGYTVVGLIAERVGGASFDKLLKAKIAGPLSLSSVAYDPHSKIAGPHAHGYGVNANGSLTDATTWSQGVGPGGGIVADATDEARFLRDLFQGKMLDHSLLTELVTPAFHDYALGIGVKPPLGCPIVAYDYTGAGPGFLTNMLVSRDGSRVAVLLLNGRTSNGQGDPAAWAAVDHLFCSA